MTSRSEDKTVLVVVTAAAAVFVGDEPKQTKKRE